jgi:hypothetical protein
MPTIVFKPNRPIHGDHCDPLPATKVVPDWYKKLPNTVGKDKFNNFTAKKCVPLLDSITAGYIMRTAFDFVAYQKEGKDSLSFETPHEDGYIESHGAKQFTGAPFSNLVPESGAYKLVNFYSIYTEAGYSCAFQTPAYSDTPIKILSGVVDTDEHHHINFPFYFEMPDGKTELFVPAGTPVAQVIPFRREVYDMSVQDYKQKDALKDMRVKNGIMNFYRRICHHKKMYT